MRPKYFFITIVVMAFVVLTVKTISARKMPLAKAATSNREAQVVRDDAQLGNGELNSTTTESIEIKAMPIQDGPSILESRCVQCHTEQSILQKNKTRADWDKALIKMERLGVHLSDPEKVVLLDYLAPIIAP